MRRPLRPQPTATTSTCPKGQVLRPGLCVVLAMGVALPARAAPVGASEPVEPAPPISDAAEVSSPAAEPPVTSTTAEVPLSERQAEARRVFRLAKQQFTAGEYAQAARNFEASFAAAESANTAFNAALAHDKAGRDLMTMAWFRRYLAFTASSGDKGYPHALRRVEELRARLGELRLQVDSREPVRAVLVNGEAVAMDDFPRLVEPGRIEVRLLGERADQVADIPVEVAAGGTWTIHFTGFARMAIESAPRPVIPPVVRRDPRPDPALARRARVLRTLTLTGVGVTAASAVGVGVLGGLALGKKAAWDDHLCDGNVCSDQYDAAMTDAAALHRYRYATNVMVGVTAGLAVITLALGIAALRARQKARDDASGRLRVTFAGLQLAF